MLPENPLRQFLPEQCAHRHAGKAITSGIVNAILGSDARVHVEHAAAFSRPHMVELQFTKIGEHPQQTLPQAFRHDAQIGVAFARQPAEDEAAGIIGGPPHPVDIEIPVDAGAVAGQQLAHKLLAQWRRYRLIGIERHEAALQPAPGWSRITVGGGDQLTRRNPLPTDEKREAPGRLGKTGNRREGADGHPGSARRIEEAPMI